jgi:hypothetical protein
MLATVMELPATIMALTSLATLNPGMSVFTAHRPSSSSSGRRR